METTGPEFNLPCPSGTDYAALPLYMQRLAEQIETDHVELRERIEAAYEPKVAIWRRSVTAIASGGSTSFTFDGTDLLFYNFEDPLTGLPPELGQFDNCFPQAGMWAFGWNCNTTPTGATTAGSLRIMHVGVGRQDFTGESTTIIADLSRHTVTTGGPDYFGSITTFLVPFDTNRVSVIFRFEHTNAASTVAVTAITAWCRFIGTNDPIEVVS